MSGAAMDMEHQTVQKRWEPPVLGTGNHCPLTQHKNKQSLFSSKQVYFSSLICISSFLWESLYQVNLPLELRVSFAKQG